MPNGCMGNPVLFSLLVLTKASSWKPVYFSVLVICFASIGCEPPPAKKVTPAAEGQRSADSLADQVREVREGTSDAIELESQPISDDDLEQVAGLTGLHTLVLKKAGISDAGLRHLAGLTELRTLVLGETSVTDEGLENVLGLRELETLNFAS